MFAHRFILMLLAGTLAIPQAEDAASPTATSYVPAIQVVLTGRITEEGSGSPLQGAQVYIEGGTSGTLTNRIGEYVLNLGDDLQGKKVAVVVQHIGYATVRTEITLAAGSNTLDLRLAPTVLLMEEAVLIASRTAKSSQMYPGVAADFVGRGDLRRMRAPEFNTESYAHIQENVFLPAATNPLSTFSIDVDRASYANVRRFIHDGMRPPIDAVRIEELINYFPYADTPPRGADPLAIHTEVAPAPWQPLHRLVRIALKGRAIDMSEAPASNLVFLLDVSGSMNSPDKLPLLKTAFGMLVDQLRPNDRVAIVVYAGAAGLVLPSTEGSDRETILEALQSLEAGGSTAGGAGIRLAYDVAAENHIRGGNNRVILATDGDFNIGVSSDSEMIRLIEEKREQGTFLTVLGFGTGNLQDSKMEQIADHGNGNFSYIDSALEAKKVLVNEMGGTLLTIAKDVKLQVEFNPTRVAAYRLIGYENRLLAAEDFEDDTKDAGELGAGHSVTALYEVIPVGVDSPVKVGGVDSLRYQTVTTRRNANDSPELLFVKLRYKNPDQGNSRLLDLPVLDHAGPASQDFQFASAVAAWGMLLRDSEFCEGFTLDQVVNLARKGLGEDPEGYRSEFIRLVETTKTLDLLEREPGATR
jgi:Ca-activated chloride channel family protein